MPNVQLHLGRTKVNNFSAIDIPVLKEFCFESVPNHDKNNNKHRKTGTKNASNSLSY